MPFSRTNESEHAFFPNAPPIANGAFKKVWYGLYTDGPRKGQLCVSKAFITRSIFEDLHFYLEIKVVNRTQWTINAWNAARIILMPILLNVPSIWEDASGEKRLVEPYIEGYTKYNSNAGWVRLVGYAWGDALQALSHFSYHQSGGQMLLCDLQGGIYPEGL